MDKVQALNFLRQHQPLPQDKEWTKELIVQYREVLDYCRVTRDADCIPLLLNAFGDGDGWENYEYVNEVLWRYPVEQVLPHLIQALLSQHRSVRYWSADVASVFPYSALIAPLQLLLWEDDEDIRGAAINGLAWIEDARVDALLEERLQQEKDEHVRQQIQEVLYSRQMLDFKTTVRRLRKEEEWPEMLDT